MIITVASQSHAAALAAIHALAFAPHDRWDAESFATLLAQPGVTGLIAAGAGFILVSRAADEAEILTLAVIPSERRRGIARTLLNESESYLRSQNVTVMFLEVTEFNSAARALYESAGFRQVGMRRRYYPDGSDALVLRKDLTRGEVTDA